MSANQAGRRLRRGERRLTAIMFTDIVGFTALAQKDEPRAMKALARHNRILRPVFSKYRGKEVKTMGDAFLVEFRSALEATKCGIAIQRSMHQGGSHASSELQVRIGIHVGDVIHRGGDVLGDAVNIASRIEPLAAGGEICISEQVYDQVRNKIPYSLEKLESRNLKNVAFPIDIYMVRLPWQRASRAGPSKTKSDVLQTDATGEAKARGMENFISKLTLKDRIVDVHVFNDPSMPEVLARFSIEVDYGRGETLHLVSAVESIAVVTDSKSLDRLIRSVPEKSILGIRKDLAEIVISFNEKTIDTPGIAATITGELAKNGVNILEYITSWDHAIVVVNENQAMVAYDTLRKLLATELPRY